MFGIGIGAAVAASYPKTIGAAYAASFDPTTGGRRTYSGLGSFASPNFTDTPGWTSWPTNGPKGALPGYTLQVRFTANNFESINAPQSTQDHFYALTIGGANNVLQSPNATASNSLDTGYQTVGTPSLSGTVAFRDWGTGPASGGTAFVGSVTLYYQYTRS